MDYFQGGFNLNLVVHETVLSLAYVVCTVRIPASCVLSVN